MTTARALLVIGSIVALSPYLGLPYSWLMALLPLLGLATLVIALRLFRRARMRASEAPAPPYDGTTAA